MFYRRSVVLSILQAFGGRLEKIALQKLLFLFSQQQAQGKRVYDFIPSQSGCFSPSAHADLAAMAAQKIVGIDEYTVSFEDSTPLQALKTPDAQIVAQLRQQFPHADTTQLTRYTYMKYPYWASKSNSVERVLSADEWQKVQNSYIRRSDEVLFTIGYEGISLEEYLNRLVLNDVRLLVDVRHNPMSMKYGFSRKTLAALCEGLGIAYEHLPEVGIASEKRKSLFAQNDYDNLFLWYRQEALPTTLEQQQYILQLLQTHRRIALTCFEADICQCHRLPLSQAIAQLPDFRCAVEHL